MSDDDDINFEDILNDPYRDDPVWQPWHASATDVVGGADPDSSSDDEEDEDGDSENVASFQELCVCEQCRLGFIYLWSILLPF